MNKLIEKIVERLEELQNYACFPTEFVSEEQEPVYKYFRDKLTKILNDIQEEAKAYNAELIKNIEFGIEASNTNDNYMIGLRNGMRWCLSLIDGKEPKFEKCSEVKTNADYIRSLSDEELAEFLDNVFNNLFEGYEFPCEYCTEKINCDVCFKDWLKAEREG